MLQHFSRFINNYDYSFAVVNTTNDLKALKVSGLKCPNLVNIHHHYCSHTNTSPCTLDAGGDAPQLTSKETRPEARYAGNSAGAFEVPKPHMPGRDPVRARGGYGLP